MSQSDPYKPLTQAIKNLNEPVNEMLRNHRKLLARHSDAIKNVKGVESFNMLLGDKLNQRDGKP